MRFLLFCILFYGFIQNSWCQNWEDLISEDGLSEFSLLNGKADFFLEDGILVGVSKTGTPNSFLATNKSYQDFILEFEVLIENGMNSGVQFRSESLKNYRNGRVHGYQAEIETSERKWAGGIYDEARRAWLYPLSMNVKGQSAFINDQWNHYRIEAFGDHLKVYVNNILCSYLVDDLTSEGFIAFQVHSINNSALEGKKVKWKNIRILTDEVEQYLIPEDPEVRQISYLTNRLTEVEKRNGWKMLWDGVSSNGWVSAKGNSFPEKGWKIEKGILKVLDSGGAESENGGDIVTVDDYANFELELDFLITSGANSGIKYFVDPQLNKGLGSAIGLEFQILDDRKHPDAKKGVNGNRTVGSLYDIIRADNLSEANRNTKRFNGVGQWNRARIVSKDGNVEHWLNGVKVVEYDRYSQMFRALVEKSKYVIWPNFGQLKQGRILLQDHGDEVWFQNIKIREL